MKVLGVDEARAQLADVLQQAQQEPVLLLRRGKPIAVVTGVEGQDLATLVQGSAPAPPKPGRRRAPRL